MVQSWKYVVFLALSISTCQPLANAADVQILLNRELTLGELRSGKCNIRLTGEIRWGDAKKVEPWKAYREQAICLNSPGGNYLEGIKLAKLFSRRGFSTVIEDGTECLSACAIAFMGGTYFVEELDTPTISRRLHVGGKLGFHAPSLIVEKNQYDKHSVEVAYKTAIKSIAMLMKFSVNRTIVQDSEAFSSESALDSRWPYIRAGLIFEALSVVGPERLFYIDTVDKAGRWGIDITGLRLVSLTNEDWARACWNFYAWHRDESAKAGGFPRMDGSSDVWRFEYTGTKNIPWAGSYTIVRRKFAILGMISYYCQIDEYMRANKPEIYKIELKEDDTSLGAVTMSPWHALEPRVRLESLKGARRRR